jgi:uncharacterized small protein (DUF1192 family)
MKNIIAIRKLDNIEKRIADLTKEVAVIKSQLNLKPKKQVKSKK